MCPSALAERCVHGWYRQWKSVSFLKWNAESHFNISKLEFLCLSFFCPLPRPLPRPREALRRCLTFDYGFKWNDSVLFTTLRGILRVGRFRFIYFFFSEGFFVFLRLCMELRVRIFRLFVSSEGFTLISKQLSITISWKLSQIGSRACLSDIYLWSTYIACWTPTSWRDTKSCTEWDSPYYNKQLLCC